MTLDTTLAYAGIAGQLAVASLLLYRRTWRSLPIFCVYSFFTLLGGVVAVAVMRFIPTAYFMTYLTEEGIDSALQFCVLVELSWSILRPIRASLPGKTLWVLGFLIAATGAIIWPFVNSSAFARYPMWHFLFHLKQTVSILRILFFLLLAGCSQLLSIGWRDRELQVATGLGFYSLASLAATVVHAHETAGSQHAILEQLLVASYICSLLYWAVCFAQQEAARREFTPQMQNMLLAVAGAARTTRISLSDSSSDKLPNRRDS